MTPHPHLILSAILVLVSPWLCAGDVWWNKDWTHRQKITLDSSAIGGSAGESTILVRISDGMLFAAAREDGGDLRFVSPDGKTRLPHHVERFDSLLGEAFVWVKIPAINNGKNSFFLYFGNHDASPPGPSSDAYASHFTAVHHFSEVGAPPIDATTNGNHATAPATITEGAMIGTGLRITQSNPVVFNAANRLAWSAGNPLSISFWLKPTAPLPDRIILSRGVAASAFKLLLDQGSPVVEVSNGDKIVRSPTGPPITPDSWNHIALVADAGTVKLFVNAEPFSSVAAMLPALSGPITLGALQHGIDAEVDELRISDRALSPVGVRLEFLNQGGMDVTQPFLTTGGVEIRDSAGGQIFEHLMLFSDIAGNMMFDGWVAIGVCAIMIVVSWSVGLRKFSYLRQIEKDNQVFLHAWDAISHARNTPIHISDSDINLESVQDSPLYQIYQTGAEEIRHRLETPSGSTGGLSSRSMQAIRAKLDAGLLRESQRLSDGLVYLTISIAGGPYVGLLGTVVGVMITFAIIAKSGEVNVNSIAPGIASALLATVVGLVVAIPALFIYSYLNNRIRNVVGVMQRFIDEFVAIMAEFHEPKPDAAPGSSDSN